jgi:hypothetical protein
MAVGDGPVKFILNVTNVGLKLNYFMFLCFIYTRSSGKNNRLLSFDTTQTGYETTRPTILLLLHVYNHCGGNVFIEPLPVDDREIRIQTHRLMGEIFEYAVEMGSGAVIYITKFHKVWFRHSKVDRRDTQTRRK